MPSGGAVAEGMHCGAGPVNTAVGIHLASGCLVFIQWHSILLPFQLWKEGQGAAGMRSVLDPFQLKCSSFKLFLNKLQNSSLSAKPRATAPVKVQERSILNMICNVLFFFYVYNAEMFLKLIKQYYIKKVVHGDRDILLILFSLLPCDSHQSGAGNLIPQAKRQTCNYPGKQSKIGMAAAQEIGAHFRQ